jgi:transposase
VISAQADIWLVLGSTDMRKSIDGLSLLVADQLNMDALSGQLFVFCNRARSIIKILYWERNGFCLWQKRLEGFRFFWPSSEHEVQAVDKRYLFLLLEGINPLQIQGHPVKNFSILA